VDRNNRCPVGDSCKVRRDGGGFRGHACGAIGRGAGWRGRLSIDDPGVVRSAAEITNPTPAVKRALDRLKLGYHQL
jgi:hypothetical protein